MLDICQIYVFDSFLDTFLSEFSIPNLLVYWYEGLKFTGTKAVPNPVPLKGLDSAGTVCSKLLLDTQSIKDWRSLVAVVGVWDALAVALALHARQLELAHGRGARAGVRRGVRGRGGLHGRCEFSRRTESNLKTSRVWVKLLGGNATLFLGSVTCSLGSSFWGIFLT